MCIVGMVSTALVLNYLMAGPAMAVFRKLAPQLPRPVRIPLPGLWGAAGCAASSPGSTWPETGDDHRRVLAAITYLEAR
jgi:amino acid transporter